MINLNNDGSIIVLDDYTVYYGISENDIERHLKSTGSHKDPIILFTPYLFSNKEFVKSDTSEDMIDAMLDIKSESDLASLKSLINTNKDILNFDVDDMKSALRWMKSNINDDINGSLVALFTDMIHALSVTEEAMKNEEDIACLVNDNIFLDISFYKFGNGKLTKILD